MHLELLIDELEVIGNEDALLSKAYAKESIIMRAIVLRTIKEFSGSNSLLGWSTKS